MIFSAYRRDDYADPKSFVAQLGIVLQDYPDSVIEHVSHPRTGVQRRYKFPPSIAEIAEACDYRLRYEVTMAKYMVMPRIAKREEQERPEPTPEQRAEMTQKFSNLLKEIRATNVVGTRHKVNSEEESS